MGNPEWYQAVISVREQAALRLLTPAAGIVPSESKRPTFSPPGTPHSGDEARQYCQRLESGSEIIDIREEK
jgi:hypothetical protein